MFAGAAVAAAACEGAAAFQAEALCYLWLSASVSLVQHLPPPDLQTPHLHGVQMRSLL